MGGLWLNLCCFGSRGIASTGHGTLFVCQQLPVESCSEKRTPFAIDLWKDLAVAFIVITVAQLLRKSLCQDLQSQSLCWVPYIPQTC